MPAAEGVLLALAAMIAGSILGQSIGGLVSAPLWLMLAVALAFAAAVVVSKDTRLSAQRRIAACGWAVLGVTAGFTLPASLPPPRSAVSAQAVAGLRLFAGASGEHADIFTALEVLDEDPRRLVGRRITVTGTWRSSGTDAASVSERVMACCAADAVDVGLDVFPARIVNLAAGTRVRVSGVIHGLMHDGELRYRLDDATVIVAPTRPRR